MTDEAPKTFADMDFRKFFAEMKLPALPDMETLMGAHRRNMEAMSAANRVTLEGAQAVARRHMQIMQQSMSELTDTMRTLATTEGAQAKAAKQAEMLKAAYEGAVTNMREQGELIQRSNSETMGVINKRVAEAMDEVKALNEKA
ncbi:MAG TPA: phasin family protein [Acetobacteraceae bacterium]|nr:phasin family protein [Acetobacteraceae bacterium]